MTEHDPARQAADYDSGAGWNRQVDAMDKYGYDAVRANSGLIEDPPPWCACCWGTAGECECDETCDEDDGPAWPDDVIDDGYRPTVDAKVKGDVL